MKSNINDEAGRNQIEFVATKFEEWHSKKTTRPEKVPLELLRETQKLNGNA